MEKKDTDDDDEGDCSGHCSWIDEISVSSSVWVSPGLISTRGTVSLLRYSALTFARTTEHATGIICGIIFYTTQLKGDRSRGEEVEGTEGRRENEQESLAWHSLVTLHCVLNFCRGLCV